MGYPTLKKKKKGGERNPYINNNPVTPITIPHHEELFAKKLELVFPD